MDGNTLCVRIAGSDPLREASSQNGLLAQQGSSFYNKLALMDTFQTRSAVMSLPAALPLPTVPTSFLHRDPPYRAEHVGSLLRPLWLMEKRALFEECKCSADELRAAEDQAIAAALKQQQEIGLRTWTDGEMRRGAFYEGMFEKLEGMENVIRPIETFKDYLPYVQFFLMMGPIQLLSESYFADLVQAYREELSELYYLGCRHIQIDDPTFAFFCADSTIEGMEKAGVDSEKLFDRYIKLYNDILAHRPSDLTVGLHTCRGNYKGLHYCQGGYSRIAPKLFNEMNVDCFYLEYDTDRSGDLEPLKYLPLNKSVVLGLITTKSGKLEKRSEVEARIEEAVDFLVKGSPTRSKAYARNQICISPQCGFASVAEGNPITPEVRTNEVGDRVIVWLILSMKGTMGKATDGARYRQGDIGVVAISVHYMLHFPIVPEPKEWHCQRGSPSDPFSDPPAISYSSYGVPTLSRNAPPQQHRAPPPVPPKNSSGSKSQSKSPMAAEVATRTSSDNPRTKMGRSQTQVPQTSPSRPQTAPHRSMSQDTVLRAANTVEKAKATSRRAIPTKKGSSHADVIDRLDFSGVGPMFHHDGPFDACAPSRNRHRTRAPMLAWAGPAEEDKDALANAREIPSAQSPYPSPAIYAPYEAPKKKHDAIAEAWGIHEPEPFEDFSAGGGYSGGASSEFNMPPAHHESSRRRNKEGTREKHREPYLRCR
ncbi:hypothetical protein NM688_g8342 [Phlebia brevispora]|uniref:Uncharacterized protein n=1 Tax=Phlebia brevispora TaxID=194682 RepID=A0ACC1RSI1_9APHY|nr:hypothetical protein NM688_g8342 [Phlebia brevispora]